MTINDALAAASSRLSTAGVDEPRREASSLLSFTLGKPTSFLIAHPEYALTAAESASYEDAVARRERREPFQYITGTQEFWGLDFEVAPGVLIPRPETEVLVEAAIAVLAPLDRPRFVEAGVGSGCISVSILHSVANATAIATDLSERAIETAARNAQRHGVDARLEVRKADLFPGIEEQFDLVLSNPPYIPDAEIPSLQPEVRLYEPHSALVGGSDGLEIIRRIVSDARQILRTGGVLMMEIGAGQGDDVAGLLGAQEWKTPVFLNDLQGIPRTVIATRC